MPDKPVIFGSRSTPATKQGGSSTLRDRSRAYGRLRLSILDAHPLCRYCFANGAISAATVIDHLIALSLGGSNDRSNLVASCATCNDAKSLDERRFLARGYDPADIRLDRAMSRWFRAAAINSPTKSE